MQQYEKTFGAEYLYDGIQNIQFSVNSPIVYLKNPNSRVYIDAKFAKTGNYTVYATINFNNNPSALLQTGVMYPNEKQYPVKPLISRIKATTDSIVVGKISILPNHALTQPIFINLAAQLAAPINITSITIKGNGPIDYPYVEWWNATNNTGKRPYQHANHMVSNSIFDTAQISNPCHMYRELIVLKWHMHTYATAINGPSTYMGIDFAENKVVFSVWNAEDGSRNEIVGTGVGVKTNEFDHEGSGSYFEYKGIQLALNNKYGFYISYEDDLLANKTKYSGYFIDLSGSAPKWTYIGSVLHHKVHVRESRIGGFLENYMTANGHLYTRSVAIGNGWLSSDGVNWVPSNHEEAVMDDLKMQNAATYSADAKFIKYSIGGRVGMSEVGLKHHGPLRTYDVYKTTPITDVPAHLLLRGSGSESS